MKEIPNCSNCIWYKGKLESFTTTSICTAQGYAITIDVYYSDACMVLYEKKVQHQVI